MRLLALLMVWSFLFLISVSSAHAAVFINEFSSVISNDDWVEIYNSSDQSINLSNYTLIDGSASGNAKSFSCTLTAKGFMIILWSNSLNNGGDIIRLKNESAIADCVSYGDGAGQKCEGKDSVDLETILSGEFAKRSIDGSGNWIKASVSTKDGPNDGSVKDANAICYNPTPTPTESSTPTSTPTPTPAKTIYKINKSKDQNGQLISNVKIYVDNLYTHHEDDEILEFCNGCFCDDAKIIQCGYGEHTIKLTKTEYSDWSELRNFIQGASYEITPILTKISSEPTSTSTPTPTLTPTSTPTPTPTPSVANPPLAETLPEDPQAEPDLASLDTPLPLDEFDVLGSSDSAPPSIPENQVNLRGTSTIFGVAIATVGLLALAFWRLRKLTVSAKMKP